MDPAPSTSTGATAAPAAPTGGPPAAPDIAQAPSPDASARTSPTKLNIDASTTAPTAPTGGGTFPPSPAHRGSLHPGGTSPSPIPSSTAAIIPPVPGADEKARIEALLATAEGEFRATLADVAGDDDTLAKFRVEYEKLHRSLVRSVMTGCRLFDQYAHMHRAFHENVHTAKVLSESTSHDEATIRTLRGQIKRANEFLESARVKEDKSKDELRQLRIEERTINDLVKVKEEALKDLDMELERIAHLRARVADMADTTRHLDAERRLLDADIHLLKEKVAARKMDVDAELRNKENLEADLRDMRDVVSVKIAEVKQKQDHVNRAIDDIALLQNQAKTQKQMLDKLARDHEALVTKADKYRAECDEQILVTNALVEDNNGILKELRKREVDLAKVGDDLAKNTKVHDGLQKKIRALEAKKNEAESTVRTLAAENEATYRAMDQIKADIDKSKKTIEDLTREKTLVEQNYKKLATETEREQHLSFLLQQTRLNFEQDQAQSQRVIAKLEKSLAALEEDKHAYETKIAAVQEQVAALLGHIKKRETEAFSLKRQVVDSETKLKYQQNLYETVQSDRNLHAKNLVESQHEIAEMRRQLKVMNFQINGLKEELQLKQDQLAREIADQDKLHKEIEAIDNETRNLKHQNELAQVYVRSQVAEENRLSQFVKEAEGEKQKQEHSMALVVSERDRLSAQLIKQDADLLHVYDAIKAHQYALLRSQKHYMQKKQQLTALEAEIRALVTEQRLLELQTRDHGSLKQAVHQLKAELLEEQGHIKVLSDEIQKPVNIHRWRRLEGSDPGQLETIQLLHTLQRTLIAKASEDQIKEAEIHAREATYLQLKEIQSRQVGPEVLEQLAAMEQALKARTAKLKHMRTELDMHRAQIKEHKYTLAGLDRELAEGKAVYFEKRREMAKRGISLPTVGVGAPSGGNGAPSAATTTTSGGLVRSAAASVAAILDASMSRVDARSAAKSTSPSARFREPRLGSAKSMRPGSGAHVRV
ncbi:hypothetical protein AMAG_01629 [Allomyces macrogynus ATCC 38327]|uniref:Cilia- and flagella-associated protein 58 central coiled coil domain-containing protein n=1 Tax=Allomyces macrogynus (strain ATCC 38327) TaxID=578462 RepID=A0A0L0RZ98_ALLM3|nr:hypothetical protein AMAG_01629 [Allomyces macrogynus ATCC 38327]|eukprot:KNE55752.1 hypothetical protein AMAG_01629 [Allomyces macrogynus ATCC 38327]